MAKQGHMQHNGMQPPFLRCPWQTVLEGSAGGNNIPFVTHTEFIATVLPAAGIWGLEGCTRPLDRA